MFIFGGNNQFDGRFDFYEWSAPFYETPQEVHEKLQSLNLRGKKLMAIYAVGGYGDIAHTNTSMMYYRIVDAGIEPTPGWWETYPNLNRILLPWDIELCEPVQLVFDDGSTLEILPIEDGGARIGVNSIPKGLTKGLNDSAVDLNSYFREFVGSELCEFELKITKTETQTVGRSYTEQRTKYALQLSFEHCNTLTLTQSWGNWFALSAKGGENHEKIPYERVTEAKKKTNQVQIVNGRDGGGTFWIVGLNTDKDAPRTCYDRDCFGISIDDTEVMEYLGYFLRYYFDPTVQKRFDEEEEVCFDSYDTNRYTFQTMRKMLSDIRIMMELLKTDFDNPVLDRIKSQWSLYPYTNRPKRELSPEEIKEATKKALPVALDFYERFCARMEHMLAIPGHDMISFAGP